MMIERLYQRVLSLIGRGRIKTVNDSGPVQFVQIKLGQNETRDNTRRLAEYGFVSNPPVDSDGIAVFAGGDRSKGVVIATGNQTHRLRNLQPGESAMHDDLGQYIWLTQGGIVIDGAGLPVTLNNVPQVTINSSTEILFNTPVLKVNGDIMATGNISDQNGAKGTLQHVRDNYDVHTHPGIQVGSASTGTPSNTL